MRIRIIATKENIMKKRSCFTKNIHETVLPKNKHDSRILYKAGTNTEKYV